MTVRIEDYAIIGDLQTAALVGKDGSIDWLCVPRFDGGACFCALLGSKENGHWTLAPDEPITAVRRRYLPESLVLETEFETASGVVRLLDFMPPRTSALDVVRIAVGVRGAVKMTMSCRIRFDYGSAVPWVTKIEGGITAVAGPDSLELWSSVEMHGEQLATLADFTLAEGESVPFVLTWHLSHEAVTTRIDPQRALDETVKYWQAWAARCTYQGPYRDPVVRSLITLKALTYSPTGGVVAAATTSLPEQWQGERNWDYRFCWLRDATFTLFALLTAGYAEEAHAWRDWLLRAVAGDPSQLQIMYGLSGERRLTELTLPWLSGYEGAQPVRVGNAAHEQLQLDVYGEVLDLLHATARAGLTPSDDAWAVQCALLREVEARWREPDEGIWEVRSGRKHFTHSKVMAWVAFDRGIKSAEQFGLCAPLAHWQKLRAEIHADVCRHGYNQELGIFTQSYGATALDASLLALPHLGFLPAIDPRMERTIRAIQAQLTQDGLVRRYSGEATDDGLPPGEGTFLLCSFWLADDLALLGDQQAAVALYEHLLSLQNDVGLLAEQYDPGLKRMMGNFPQAFSHVALVNTAFNLGLQQAPSEERQK